MSSQIEEFRATASQLGVSEKGIIRAWQNMLSLKISVDDPEYLRVLLHEQALEDIERLKSAGQDILAKAESTITNAANETAANLTKAAARVEKSSSAKLAAQQAELVTSVSAQISTSANQALSRKVAVHDRNSFTSWIGAAVVAIGLACGGGYYLGSANEMANAARVHTLFSREDGSAWLSLSQTNNAKASLDTYCRAGSENVHRVQGGVYCQMPLWLQHDGVVSLIPGGVADPAGVLAIVSGWLASWGPWWLLAAGALFFLFLRFLANVFIDFEYVRVLLVLPPRPYRQPTE